MICWIIGGLLLLLFAARGLRGVGNQKGGCGSFIIGLLLLAGIGWFALVHIAKELNHPTTRPAVTQPASEQVEK